MYYILQMSKLPTVKSAMLDDKKEKKLKHIGMELEEKTKEVQHLKQELNQMQELVLEIPRLKSDLQKSKQEANGLSGVMFSCRKENNKQKEVINKLHKELKENEASYKVQCEAMAEKLTSELEEGKSECLQLREVTSQHEKEAEGNHEQCQILSGTVDRLEVRYPPAPPPGSNNPYIIIPQIEFTKSSKLVALFVVVGYQNSEFW